MNSKIIKKSLSLFSLVGIIALLILGFAVKALSQSSGSIRHIAPDSTHSTAFSYYNTSPESPDGRYIVFVQYNHHQPVYPGHEGSGSLWVYNKASKRYRKLVAIDTLNYHNGARQQWVGNQYIAYVDGDNVMVINSKTGKVTLGPIPIGERGRLGNNNFEATFYSRFTGSRANGNPACIQ